MSTAFVSAAPLSRRRYFPLPNLSAPVTIRPFHSVPSHNLRAKLTAEAGEAAGPPASMNANPSCFGRGKQFPRRAVGLYELEREGINPSGIISEDSRTEAGFSLVVGFFVLSLVVFPAITPGASLEGPLALLAGAGMTAWAVDALALGGVGGRAIALWLQDGKRVAYHEAGHFLVGFLLGFGVEGYSLPSPGSVLKMKRGEQGPGVRFVESRAAGDAYCVSAVGMGGIAAEVLRYGASEGGAADMADVSRGIRNCYGGNKVQPEQLKGIVRWGLIEAVQLLKEHEKAHDALCVAMLEGRSVEECVGVVERLVNAEQLAEKRFVFA